MSEKPTYEDLEQRIRELEQAEIECNQVEERLSLDAAKASALLDDTGNPIKMTDFAMGITNRKEFESRLKPSEALLNTTQKLSKIGGWEIDLEKQLTFLTDEFYRIHDLEPGVFPFVDEKDVPGKRELIPDKNTKAGEIIKMSSTCYDPEDLPVVREAYNKCLETGKGYDLELPFTTTKGRRIWVRTITNSVMKNGKVVKLVGTLQDITELKQAEETLRESEEKHRLLAENTVDMIWQMNLDMEFTYVNQAILSLLGYTPEEFIGSKLHEHCSTEEMEKIQGMFVTNSANLHTQTNEPVETSLYKKNGEEIPCEVTGKIILDEAGNPMYFQGNTRDIKERKQAVEKLKQREEMLSAVISKSPIPTVVGGYDGSVISFNEEFEKLTGYKEAEVKDAEDMVSKLEPDLEYREFFWKNIQQVLKGVQPSYKEFEIVCKDGTPKTISFYASFFTGGIIVQLLDITKHKQVEETQIQRETLLNATQKLAKVGGWEWDVEKQSHFWTDEVYRIHDFQLNESKKGAAPPIEDSIECYDPEDRPMIRDAYERCLEKGEAYDLEVPFTTAKNRRLWIRTVAEPILKGDRVVKVIGNIMDITERKKAEKERAQLKHDYETLFHEMLNSMALREIIRDEDGMPVDYRYVAVNHAFELITGMKAQDIIGKTLLEVSPDTEPYWMEIFERVAVTGKPVIVDNYSKEIGRHLQMTVFKTSSNQLADTSIDITDRKRADESLRESEAKFRSVVTNLQAVIFIINNEGIFELSEGGALDLIGIEPGQVVGQSVFELYKDYPHVIKSIEGALKGETTHAISQIGEVVFEVLYNPLKDSSGNVYQVIGVGTDITMRKQLEDSLQQSQKMESIGTLAGGIAHDFNNILSIIIGFTEVTLDEVEKETNIHNNLQAILKAGLRASDLTKQILTFSRQSDKKAKPLKVQLIIGEVLKLIRSTMPTTIEIKHDISDKCGWVMADATQVHQVAMNLTTNAYHAMEDEGGILEVTLKEVEFGVDDLTDQSMNPGAYVCLNVSDTGSGIDQSVINRVFEPYFTTKEDNKGTGLGLAVVHGIVKSYGGDIRVYSKPGRGTAFHVYLPVIKSQVETGEPDLVAPVPGGTERILLVDDEDEIVRMEKQMLERLGYDVMVRTSSIEALEMFRTASDKFDLIITDMTMPNITGIQLSQKLLEIRPDIPIIICTGFSTGVDEEKATAVGIRGLVMKPVVKSEIAQKIREVLDQD